MNDILKWHFFLIQSSKYENLLITASNLAMNEWRHIEPGGNKYINERTSVYIVAMKPDEAVTSKSEIEKLDSNEATEVEERWLHFNFF